MSNPWIPTGGPLVPPGYSPPSRSQRRWPTTVAIAAASAVLAATVAALITARVSSTDNSSGHSTAPAVTVTATPPPPAPPAPLPTAQADRETCNAWHAAGDKIHAALKAQAVIPEGMTVLDPAVRSNPGWTAAVRTAASLYGQSGDTLTRGIAAGTTPILEKSAVTAAAALHALSAAVAAFDAANGNMNSIVHESADAMDVLCDRLAPR